MDANTATEGAMEIALGSHHKGKVNADRAAEVARDHTCVQTIAEVGDVLVLPMQTLHRSPPSQKSKPRRTLRLDYALEQLPTPLEWVLSA